MKKSRVRCAECRRSFWFPLAHQEDDKPFYCDVRCFRSRRDRIAGSPIRKMTPARQKANKKRKP